VDGSFLLRIGVRKRERVRVRAREKRRERRESRFNFAAREPGTDPA
jgi:hypothetical protein